MANTDAPFGFRAAKMLDGSPYNGATIRCSILAADSTATFIGDAVKLSGTASADGYPSVAQAAKTDEIYGVVDSFVPDFSNLETKHRAASTLRYCNVVPALDVLFEIQADEDVVIADVGECADMAVTAGSTVTGLSKTELDSSDIGSNTNLQIVGIVDRPDNEAASNFTKVLVRINESGFRGDGTKA